MENTLSLAPSAADEFLANQAFLRRLAWGLVHDAGRAEDLVQETFAVWAERRPRGLATPRAWLARVLKNRARNVQREEERRAHRERAVARPEALDAGESTLEVQAQVVAVLHGLDEPQRNALLLRYFHELTPSEIASRTGTPLNTVKDRLARGLARMRAELDRRHAGDRRAWSQWLLPLVARSDAGLAPRAGVPHPAALATGAPPWLALACGACVLFVVAAVYLISWSRASAESGVALASNASEPAPVELRAALVPAFELESPSAPARVPVTPARAPKRVGLIEWPQYARNAAHDGFDPGRKDLIRTPAVLWHVEGSFGQPTLSGGDLYSGGRGLARIDPGTGAVIARVLAPESNAKPDPDADPDAKPGAEPPPPTVAEAPAITATSVLARRIQDGGVTAFDRTLERELWSWKSPTRGGGHFAGCLAGELFVVGSGASVFALRVADGAEAWHFQCEGDVNMVPAAADGRVFIGEEGGTFYALSLADGHEMWRTDTGGWLGWTSPVVVKDRVVFGDRGNSRARSAEETEGRRGQVRALAVRDGRELWNADFGATGFSTPGVAKGYVVAGFGSSVSRFALDDGKIDSKRTVRTGKNAFGSPSVVGESLVFGNLDGNLYVHGNDDGKLRWRFYLQDAQLHAFVHAGERIYASSTVGLFCIGDDDKGKRIPDGFVLDWTPSGN